MECATKYQDQKSDSESDSQIGTKTYETPLKVRDEIGRMRNRPFKRDASRRISCGAWVSYVRAVAGEEKPGDYRKGKNAMNVM